MEIEIVSRWNKIKEMMENSVDPNRFNIPKETTNLIEKLTPLFNLFFLEKLDNERQQTIIGCISKINNIYYKKVYFINDENIYFDFNDFERVDPLLSEMYDIFRGIDNFEYLFDIYTQGQEVFKFIENEFKKQSGQIKLRANDLFGNLSSASLHKVYGDEKENISFWILAKQMFFYIILFVVFGFLVFGGDYNVILSGKVSENELYYLISRFLILSPVFWAMFFLSSQIKNDKKIEQTYLHKQTIAKSYVNYLEFINNQNLSNADEVKSTLSRIAVEALGLNPALLLEKSTAEKIPMEELLSKLIDKSTSTISSKNTS